ASRAAASRTAASRTAASRTAASRTAASRTAASRTAASRTTASDGDAGRVVERAATAPAVRHPAPGRAVSAPAPTAPLPFDHLFAELAAFPLASEAALVNPLTHLDPAMTTATARLWRAAERELLAAAPGVSLDDLVALRDGCWFAEDGDDPRPLQAFL